jgi:hypothetical protein
MFKVSAVSPYKIKQNYILPIYNGMPHSKKEEWRHRKDRKDQGKTETQNGKS